MLIYCLIVIYTVLVGVCMSECKCYCGHVYVRGGERESERRSG